MALPPATDEGETFIREVDEEYRRDQLARFWTRYGRWLLIGLGVFLIAFAGYLYWREEQNRAAGTFGERLMQASEQLSTGNVEDAGPVFAEAAASNRDGYEALGRLAQAAIAANRGKTADAIKMYEAIAADDDLALPFRDLATIRQLMLQYDTLPHATLVAKLQPLAKPGNPWFGTAGEMLAVAHMRSGKPELAGPLFAAIAKDQGVPASIRSRAGQMASMLGVSALPAAPEGDAPAAPPAKAQ